MEFISYNAELGTANQLFMRLFNNIQIERTDKKGRKGLLKVPCVFGQRSRIVKALENPDNKAQYKVPMIVINRTGYQRQSDRLNNLHNEVKYEVSSNKRYYHLLTPVPVDISYDVSVIAKYPADIDKIASNFMVFFNNDIYCSQAHPKFSDIKLNNQVIMGDSVSEEHPDEMDASRDDLVISNFSFTFKTYLFGGTEQYRKVRSKKPVVDLSATVSSYVHEFKNDDEVAEYIRQQPHSRLSTTLTAEVTAQVTSYVDDISSDEYDDGVPKIRGLNFGFYAVPKQEDILGYMTSVDNELIARHEHFYPSSYISSGWYGGPVYQSAVGPEGEEISAVLPQPVATSADWYDVVDNYCTLAPYVDRIFWKIDGASPYEYPYNVRPYNGCEGFRRQDG